MAAITLKNRAKKRIKPFTAWLLYDALDTYADSVHIFRQDAVSEREKNSNLIDAKWRIVKVRVSAL